jgi:multiple sugar transport system substrate-binding protein
MKRTCTVLLVVLTVIMNLTGCTYSNRSVPSAHNENTVNLRIAWWGGDLRNDITLQVIKRYESLHPHVKIEYETLTFSDYWKKIAPLAAGNVLPDIIQMDVSYLSQYSSLNLLEDLSPYIQNGTIDISSINEQYLSGGRINGKLYGFNLGINALYGFYDPEILRANGVAEPEENLSWDDLEKIGKTISNKELYVADYFTPEEFFSYYLRQQGYSLYHKDGSKLGYEDDRLFIDYFGRLQRLARAKWIHSPGFYISDTQYLKDDRLISAAPSLFSWSYSNQFITVTPSGESPLKVIPPPGPNLNRGLFIKPGMMFSIAKNSKKKQEAARFINYFVNDLEANLILKGERGVPVSSKVVAGMLPHVNPQMAQIFEYIAWVEKNSSPMDPPPPVGAEEVTKLLVDLYDQMLFDRLTPEAGAVQFRQRANEILAQYAQTQVQYQ